MELIRGISGVRPGHRVCAATIGNFDGVHLGHQAVLQEVMARGAELGLPATLITFEPQPQEVFRPEQAPARLTRLREKWIALEDSGLDRLLCLRFDHGLASRTPAEFVRDILVDGLGVRYLVVGDDFRFGRDRAGDFEFLKTEGARLGMQVVNMNSHLVDGHRVSSTAIRGCLADGQLERAAVMLGRPYRICGRVVHGDKRGRTIGFPTANIPLRRLHSPLSGVFVVTAHGLLPEPVRGVANIGTRPTVDGQRRVLEAHLFDFDSDIYGRQIEIEFKHKVREEKKFDSFDALKQQILNDAEQARAWFPETGQ